MLSSGFDCVNYKEFISKTVIFICISEIDEVPLLIISGHRVALLRLGISVKVLGVNEIANTWHPRWIDPTVENHAPINTTEPLVSLDFLRTILNINRQVRL